MDAPLLALTRPRLLPPSGRPPESAAAENMRQLVQLRWLAVAGQLATILAVNLVLRVPLPLAPMLGAVALLAAVNIVIAVALPRHRVTNVGIMLALLLDMGVLTAQLYFSGGAANPFVSLYLLQVVLGAILLEAWSAWVLIAAAAVGYAGLTVSRVPLAYPPGLRADTTALYTLGAWISFVLVATLLVLFNARIIRNLRARDRYLADLRERAAEEDGIVRMGLLASGAAHELGTPLASIAVILGDWRRMPRLAQDPDLAGEIEEMRVEIERCKTIVTDILHSAGEPRGERMESVPANVWLEEAVAAWRPTHADIPIAYAPEVGDDSILIADAPLRHALWNLLDNAAEVSPAGIGLQAASAEGMLTVTVTDDGPGFPPALLAVVGKAYQSTKGQGHGLGLFLAGAVARRLGGWLAAANRPEGGAKVSLTIPLATMGTTVR